MIREYTLIRLDPDLDEMERQRQEQDEAWKRSPTRRPNFSNSQPSEAEGKALLADERRRLLGG